MDENTSDDDRDNAKRLKTNTGSVGKSDKKSDPERSGGESSPSSSASFIPGAEVASTSGEGCQADSSASRNSDDSPTTPTPQGRKTRSRNYRTRNLDNYDEDTNSRDDDDERVDLDEEESTDPFDNLDSVNPRPFDLPSNLLSAGDSDTALSTEFESSDDEELAVLKKPKPKHNWLIVPELMHRQMAFGPKYKPNKPPEHFYKRTYGSLHCVQRLELMYKLEQHGGCVNSLNFHPDGSLLASGSDDLEVCIWDWKINKCLVKYESKHRSNVFQSKFMHLNGDLHIATCSRDGQVRVAQVSKQEGVRANRKLGSHKGPCHKIAVLPEQPQIILSAGEDGVVLSHDLRKNKPDKLTTVKLEDRGDETVYSLYSIHNNPLKTHEFCVGGRQEYVLVYDQRKCTQYLHSYIPFSRNINSLSVTCAVYNHDGSQILTSYSDGDIYLFDGMSKPGEYIHRYQGHRNCATIKGVNFFGPKSEYIVSGSDCGNVFFWDANTESIVQWMLGDVSGVVNCLEPHPQVPYLCTSGLDWDIKIWVPSCERDPDMQGLRETVKINNKSKVPHSHEPEDSQMLWILLRHLRNNNRRERYMQIHEAMLLSLGSDSNSSASSTTSDSSNSTVNDDDDDSDDPNGCSPS